MTSNLVRVQPPLGSLSRLVGVPEIIAPAANQRAAGGDPLATPQTAAEIGQPVPIVFCRWRSGEGGGVLVSPPATDVRVENSIETGELTARYQLLISQGQIDAPQRRDVFQQAFRSGTFTLAYGRRAGDWGPGNFLTAWKDGSRPSGPVFCGSGQGTYADLSMGSFTVSLPAGSVQWQRQVHLFARGGINVPRLIEGTTGPSDNLADLVQWALLQTGRVSPVLINAASFLAAAEFLDANQLRFNAVVQESGSLVDWLGTVLPQYLLRLTRRAGVFRLRPLLPVTEAGAINTAAIVPSLTLVNADVDLPTVRVIAVPRSDRLPVAMQVLWRQQPDDANGLVRTATVRYGRSVPGGPYQQHDLSQWATVELHAVRYGAFLLASRRYIRHRVLLTPQPGAADGVVEGDIIALELSVTDAAVGTTTLSGYYTVDRIDTGPDGIESLELVDLPVDDQGRSLVALDVSRVEASGLLFPTGRAPVESDVPENDPTDDGVDADAGPWPGWQPIEYDVPLYDPADLDLPDGVVDVPVEAVNPSSPVNPNPSTGSPVTSSWGPGLAPVYPDPYDPGNVAAVSFSTVRLGYPETYYTINQAGAVELAAVVEVSPAPSGSDLRLVVSDGQPDVAWAVRIPVGETSAALPAEVTTRTDALEVDATRTLQVLEWLGGGYYMPSGTPPEPEEDPPTAPLEVTPLDFAVKVYVGTITLQSPGLWTWDGADWTWASTADLGNWSWAQVAQRWEWGGTSTDWSWAAAGQRWEYIGTVPTGWAWLLAQQRWQRTAAETDPGVRPDGPPDQPPSPIPSDEPPGTGFYSVVARAAVDVVPIGNSESDDLALTVTDFVEVEEGEPPQIETVGTLMIPAVSMMFGSWRWNPTTSWWEYPADVSGWLWDSAVETWVPLFDTGNYTWDQATEAWVGGPGTLPGLPPLQNGTTQPPDGERWTYDPETRQWSGTAHIVGGVAPVFDGLLAGTLTYHRLLS